MQTGLLSRRRGALVFEYTQEALRGGIGRPLLSVSMPTRPRPYQGDVPRAFFDGLLPEGDARRMIAYDFGVDEHDVLGLLAAIGRDCAGAPVIIPEAEVPVTKGLSEPITDAQVADRIRNLRFAPLGVDQRVRASLAGMQEKLLLSRVGERGGPSLRHCAQMLERWSRGSEALERLLDVVTLNVLVGNADAHAKNLSLLHDAGGQVRLAPAYDVMATVHYPGVSTIPGMLVNGVRDIRGITRSDLIREAESWGMPQRLVAARIEQLLVGAEDAIRAAADEIKPPDDLVHYLLGRARSLAL